MIKPADLADLVPIKQAQKTEQKSDFVKEMEQALNPSSAIKAEPSDKYVPKYGFEDHSPEEAAYEVKMLKQSLKQEKLAKMYYEMAPPPIDAGSIVPDSVIPFPESPCYVGPSGTAYAFGIGKKVPDYLHIADEDFVVKYGGLRETIMTIAAIADMNGAPKSLIEVLLSCANCMHGKYK